MNNSPPGSLMTYLAEVPDPRDASGKRHPLVAMLTHACCAMLCGARGNAVIAQWGRGQPIELMHRIGYRRRPASHGAFQSLLSRLDAAALERALARWDAHLLGEPAAAGLRAVALDGKASPGSLTAHDPAVHLLAAMDQRTGCVLVTDYGRPSGNPLYLTQAQPRPLFPLVAGDRCGHRVTYR